MPAMETDLEGLHCAVRRLKQKGHAQGLQENTMSKPSHHKARRLEVQIMFEPSRLQQNCLHQAYAYLVPIAHRHLAVQGVAAEMSAVKQTRERNVP
jgi:hypothetical protein